MTVWQTCLNKYTARTLMPIVRTQRWMKDSLCCYAQKCSWLSLTDYLNISLLQKESFCTEDIKVAEEGHAYFSNGTKHLITNRKHETSKDRKALKIWGTLRLSEGCLYQNLLEIHIEEDRLTPCSDDYSQQQWHQSLMENSFVLTTGHRKSKCTQSSKYWTEKLGKEQPRRCERRNKTNSKDNKKAGKGIL